jgi:N-acetyl-gamma-glutamyl-phosphate reductase
VIDLDDIIIDLATGVSGAGRSPSEAILHSEVSEGFHAYNVAKHRHTAEFDQEFSKVAKRQVEVTFTPHLLPQNRGILATIYVKGDADQVHESLVKKYNDEFFISILPLGESPATRHVRGSNFVHIGVVADRRSGRCRVFSTLDNLTKGSAGQAIQNANLMLGIKEDSGLLMAPLFP